jgi:RNAse (barnase) inhibitor barstar
MEKADMTKTLMIEGGNVRGIATLYDEINRVFMADEDWKLGPSLDAIDDMLGGAYGAIASRERVKLVWQNMEASRSALNRAATRLHLLDKLQRPDVFNAKLISRQLEELEAGVGRTRRL